MIHRLCIIGVGLIGGSLARDLRRLGLAREIVGHSRRVENLRRAVELRVIDRFEVDAARAVDGADVVVIAAPLGAMTELGKRHTRYARSIEDKESMKWLRSFEALCELQQRCAETTLVSVGDREADIYELFVRAKRPGSAQLLIRAERTRRMVAEHGPLWDYMATQPLAGNQVIDVPRRPGRAPRRATMEIRFAEVELAAPKRKRAMGALRLWAVWTHEPNPPQVKGVKALDWMVLTTVPVHTFDDVLERLAWYRQRWSIELYHRTLKSGCRIKARQLATAKRLEACLAIDMVVAWRIYHLAKLGRETPDVPCTVYFEEAQWQALVSFAYNDASAPQRGPPSLNEAMRLVAKLGGFLARKGDGHPGTKTLWLGLQRLDDVSTGMSFILNAIASGKLVVSSKYDYG